MLLSLEMLLCPNQSSRLVTDLVPSLTCAARAADGLAMFARRFYSVGFASGCAGCLIFIVVLYLDRLNRHPVHWGYFPRLEVWNMEEIRMAISEDRLRMGVTLGSLGLWMWLMVKLILPKLGIRMDLGGQLREATV